MIRWLLLLALVPSLGLAKDFEIRVVGDLPANPEVLTLVRSYTPNLMAWTSIDDRDSKRRPLVSSNYFYHDLNGSDIGFDGLTARHKKNDLRVSEGRIFDAILYQQENSAILTYKSWTKGSDKGHPFEGTGSAAIVMSRTSDGWRVTADIMGQDPPPTPEPSKH